MHIRPKTSETLRDVVPANGSSAETTIGAGVSFKGEIACHGTFRVHGTFEGRLSGKARLYAGKGSRIVADAVVSQAVIEGEFEGSLTATERVELASTARLKGDIRAPRLVIADGATLVGHETVGSHANGNGHKPAPPAAVTSRVRAARKVVAARRQSSSPRK
ncbi:MAG: polymer-forming cytoskeletal protein [Planctomycetes bacterium]|nr:polymer-forming cytoskeletal protein [Planctomycetota bacterium]